MPTPVIASTALSVTGNNTTSHAVTMPAGVVSGDLLIIFMGLDGGGTLTWPSGFVELIDVAAQACHQGVAYKVSDGTEGASITVTSTASEKSAHVCYRITGQSLVTNPEVSSTANGENTLPNPPALTPTGGAKNYLWLVGWGGDGGTAFLTLFAPLSYSGSLTTSTVALGSCSVGTAHRALNAASENPSTFQRAGVEGWIACVVAVHPGVAVEVLNTGADLLLY